jgi:hypothetical protein
MAPPIKILLGFLLIQGVFLSPFISRIGTIWWDEGTFLGAVIFTTLLYALVLGFIYGGPLGWIKRQFKYHSTNIAFRSQAKLLKEAKVLHSEGLLTDTEYQARVTEIKRH